MNRIGSFIFLVTLFAGCLYTFPEKKDIQQLSHVAAGTSQKKLTIVLGAGQNSFPSVDVDSMKDLFAVIKKPYLDCGAFSDANIIYDSAFTEKDVTSIDSDCVIALEIPSEDELTFQPACLWVGVTAFTLGIIPFRDKTERTIRARIFVKGTQKDYTSSITTTSWFSFFLVFSYPFINSYSEEDLFYDLNTAVVNKMIEEGVL